MAERERRGRAGAPENAAEPARTFFFARIATFGGSEPTSRGASAQATGHRHALELSKRCCCWPGRQGERIVRQVGELDDEGAKGEYRMRLIVGQRKEGSQEKKDI